MLKHVTCFSALEHLDVEMISAGLECTYRTPWEEAYDAHHSLENLQVALKTAMSKSRAEPEQAHLVFNKFERVVAKWNATKSFKRIASSRYYRDPEVGALLTCFLESRADPENNAFVKVLVEGGYIPPSR
jgi:hypothetical protein